MQKPEMIEALKAGNVRVVFQKKDGSIKDTLMTLKTTPMFEAKTDRKKRAEDPGIVVAYDLASAQYRSFRIDRMLSFIPE